MQSVGQFNQDSSDIVVQRVEHLLEVVHLLRHVVVLFFSLRYHAHQVGHIVAKEVLDFINSVVGILYHIVQEGCNYRVGSQLQFLSHNTRHRHRVDDVRLSAFAFLSTMRFTRKRKRYADAIQFVRIHAASGHLGQHLFQLTIQILIILFHVTPLY